MAESTEKSDRNGIQVIARAAAILRVLKDKKGGLSLGQIATEVNLPRSTVQRITGALATERLVISDPSGGGVRLGPELALLAESANDNIVERCRLILSELARETGETTDLAVLRGEGLVFIDQVPGLHRLRTVSSVGDVFPLTSTANGRACLALMPRKAAMELAAQEFQRTGQEDGYEELSGLLDKIAQSGLAFDTDEHTQGISAIGFAFQDASGSYYAMSIPIPTSRFPENREKVETALRRAKANVEAAFGTPG
ncbi:IclR family transcriptional regulator [Alphaproteobacteria bacterium KMM 3653]|uniref:IclR family transcriptional regulator n=1 Tax=Harenicola maris TaxID=2841044 RepID=A0AAP2CSC7_9RHOB|nr:IclR family transcriptional regulator [Harenicola maris]